MILKWSGRKYISSDNHTISARFQEKAFGHQVENNISQKSISLAFILWNIKSCNIHPVPNVNALTTRNFQEYRELTCIICAILLSISSQWIPAYWNSPRNYDLTAFFNVPMQTITVLELRPLASSAMMLDCYGIYSYLKHENKRLRISTR